LRIVTPDETFTFGEPDKHSPELNAELRIRRPAFWMRVLLFNDLGFAEAFMYGDGGSKLSQSACINFNISTVDCDDVPAFLRVSSSRA
jgi:hypothetical protein